MVQSIEVFLQPPSPIISTSDKLPSIKSILPSDNSLNNENDNSNNTYNQQLLPTIKVNDELENPNKLRIMEPQFDSPSISPYQSSPIMTFSSSPSSTTSSIAGSPMMLPLNDNSFLLPPPDSFSFRRGRSLSNASNNSSKLSPSSSPLSSFSSNIRFLSEPPAFNLSNNNSFSSEEDYNPIFGPKRKRGRPPNTSQHKSQNDNSHFTFVKPTVWDVKNNLNEPHLMPIVNTNTPNKKMSDGINTFTTTNMDLALSIPKKKRGRKPKKQLIGNSCFVWKDLTAPRGANKKTIQKK